MATGNLVRHTKKTAIRRGNTTLTTTADAPAAVPVVSIRMPSGRPDTAGHFLTKLPAQCGVTLVIFPASLSQQNHIVLHAMDTLRMRCFVATNGMQTKVDTAYVVPVGYDADVSDSIIRLRKIDKSANPEKQTTARIEQDSRVLRASLESAFQKIAASAEHQRIEDRIRSERDRLMDILDAFVDGVYIVNTHLDMEYANPALKEQFGEPNGRKCYSYFRNCDTACPDCRIQEVVDGNTVQWEWQWKAKLFSIIDTPLRNTDGSTAKLGIVRDMTEHKLREEQQQTYERLATIEQLWAHLSSELRNPLAAIDTSAYYLRSKLKAEDSNLATHLDRIKSSVERSVHIVQNLSNLTRLGRGQLQPLDTREIITNVISEAKLPKSIKTNMDLPAQDMMVNADDTQLSMAFRNIVDNAVQAMKGSGQLTVSVRPISQSVEIQFSDTGPGIPVEHLDKIFEPLFTTKDKGVGFGLSLSRLVIESHGGTIRAKSASGAGANLLIRLPRYQQEPH